MCVYVRAEWERRSVLDDSLFEEGDDFRAGGEGSNHQLKRVVVRVAERARVRVDCLVVRCQNAIYADGQGLDCSL